MEKYALELNGVTKQYKDFKLDKISFTVPQGSIVGLIGENGAGKSTTINLITGVVKKDAGTIKMLDNSTNSNDMKNKIKEELGVVFDGSNFPVSLSAKQLNNVLKNIYSSWEEHKFFSLLKKLSLPESKKIKDYSKGMKMKLSIAAALSHDPKLLILDEATSGLDPVMRDDILDVFLDFVQDENHSILMSSHITTDLEKVADYIAFLHNGKIIFDKEKDELIYRYGIIRCSSSQFEKLDKEDILACRKKDYQWDILVADREKAARRYKDFVIDNATIDDILLLYVKGDVLS